MKYVISWSCVSSLTLLYSVLTTAYFANRFHWSKPTHILRSGSMRCSKEFTANTPSPPVSCQCFQWYLLNSRSESSKNLVSKIWQNWKGSPTCFVSKDIIKTGVKECNGKKKNTFFNWVGSSPFYDFFLWQYTEALLYQRAISHL